MNWGVIGYGGIAPVFIRGLMVAKNAKLKAIATLSGSDQLKKAKPYAGVTIYAEYKELINDPNIDIVYICTTNNLHFENVISAIEAGKHVLCEKPLTPSFEQSKYLFDHAEKHGVFLMEGMWTRFLPAYRKTMQILEDDIIGKVRLVKADFGFFNDWSEERRLLNPELNGGILLDTGNYNIFLSQDVFKHFPDQINAQASFAETGVEDAISFQFRYPDGGMAQLYSSFRCQTQQKAIIYGEKGYIKLKEYWHGTNIELHMEESTEIMEYPLRASGFEYEIEAVEDAVSKGEIESRIITRQMSLEVAQIIEDIKSVLIK